VKRKERVEEGRKVKQSASTTGSTEADVCLFTRQPAVTNLPCYKKVFSHFLFLRVCHILQTQILIYIYIYEHSLL
jgi:hypothetical protein